MGTGKRFTNWRELWEEMGRRMGLAPEECRNEASDLWTEGVREDGEELEKGILALGKRLAVQAQKDEVLRRVREHQERPHVHVKRQKGKKSDGVRHHGRR